MTITDEQVEVAARAIFAQTFRGGIDWDKCPNMHAEYVDRSRAALTAAAQAGKPAESDMRAFGAGDAACYYWPEGTSEHVALRAAYCRGAAECMGVAYLSETVEPPLPAQSVEGR